MKKFNNRASLKLAGLLTTAVITYSCTDLEPSLEDSVVVEDSSGNFAGVDAESFLSSAYDDVEGLNDQTNTYALSEVSSDELVVPTRGADWGDNGLWRTMHQHQWNIDHPHVLGTWNTRNAAVLKCTQIIDDRSNPSSQQKAQALVLRAFNMFYIVDLFGQVPFREVDEGAGVDPRVLSRAEAFDFVEKDLTDALNIQDGLSDGGMSASFFTVNKAFANFLLAKLYINKEVYTGSATEDDYTKVIGFCDAVTGYEVDDDYFGIFVPGHTNKEVIFGVDAGTGNRVWNVLQSAQGGWNGFATLGEVYDSFEEGDIRRGEPSTNGLGTGMLIGQQFDVNGEKLKDRSGADLVYTKEFPNGISGNNERTGVRPFKYIEIANQQDEQAGEDEIKLEPGRGYIIARYSDVLLMKAEAIMRGGNSGETAEGIIDDLRAVRNASAKGSYTMEELLDERRRELWVEGWRRNDQVRFGTFTGTWDMKDNTEEFRVLFPIPDVAISTNPNLTQNPGY